MTKSETIAAAIPIIKAGGVYIIRNKVNGRRYIGSAKCSFMIRWGQHLRDFRLRNHHNFKLLDDFCRMGIDAFEFDILEECPPNHCDEREAFWIKELCPEYNVYNKQKPGSPGGYRDSIRKNSGKIR
jgi:group I intron endonuclease